jgi:polyisoprenoid-binding protein YceI
VKLHPRNGGARAQPRARRRIRPTLAACALCAAIAFTGEAAAQSRMYALDPVHTRVMLAVDHAGFSRAIGTISGTTGTLRLDPGDWSSARVEARVPMQRLDLGDTDWNRATLAGNLLDASRHPHSVFVSERVEAAGERRLRIHGQLTLRGVTRPVVLDAVMNDIRRHPMPPFRRTAGFSAVAMLSRADFGITSWPGVIGDDVELRIEIEAVADPDATFTEPGTESVLEE